MVLADSGPLIFVFNGDADGIISQTILGKVLGLPDLRITGLKREVHLLRKLPPLDSGRIHVMDISLRQNLPELPAVLKPEKIQVTWYDHHEPGEPFVHPRLELHINEASGTCSAVIVNQVFGKKHSLWATMAAFGDNLPSTAKALAAEAGANVDETSVLRHCGILLNYNAYGERPGDVLFAPAYLAQKAAACNSALDFCHEEGIFGPLNEQLAKDSMHFDGIQPLVDSDSARAFLVPDEPWARRYAATWANSQILSHPKAALAMIHPRAEGTFMVSIRAPRLSQGAGLSAADLAMEFSSGGGRRLAAGINVLPEADFTRFLNRFTSFFNERSKPQC